MLSPESAVALCPSGDNWPIPCRRREGARCSCRSSWIRSPRRVRRSRTCLSGPLRTWWPGSAAAGGPAEADLFLGAAEAPDRIQFLKRRWPHQRDPDPRLPCPI